MNEFHINKNYIEYSIKFRDGDVKIISINHELFSCTFHFFEDPP